MGLFFRRRNMLLLGMLCTADEEEDKGHNRASTEEG